MKRQQRLLNEIARVDRKSPTIRKKLDKHVKMAANPYRFYRGTAQLFYSDIAEGTLQIPSAVTNSIPLTAIIGDCHLSNFGFFTEEGAHGDAVIFAPNDFDDACVGHAAWDIVRFCVSLFLSADYAEGLIAGNYTSEEFDPTAALKSATAESAFKSVEQFLTQYQATCEQVANAPELRNNALGNFKKSHCLSGFEKRAADRAAGGKKFQSKSSLAKAVDITKSPLYFKTLPERFKRLDDAEYRAIDQAFRPYVDDEILDIVQRLGAGTGSVNMSRYYLLVGPQSDDTPFAYKGPEDLYLCHIVEVKQQREASPIHYFPELSANNRLNPAHLTVDCQRRMQRRPDLVLDEGEWQGQHWLIRSRHHARIGIDPEDIVLAESEKLTGKQLKQYATACGEALALAHARGDRRSTRFETAMAKVLGDQQEAVALCSQQYALQVIEDWRWFRGL